MRAFPAALQASAKRCSVCANHLCLTVWNTKRIWKVKSGFIKKKKQPTPSRSHFRLTLVKHRNICLNTTDSLVKYATFKKPSLGLLHSWVFPSDRPSKISANMSCPGASSGFKIWTNWHQDSSALIKPSCLIYLSDQTSECHSCSIVYRWKW